MLVSLHLSSKPLASLSSVQEAKRGARAPRKVLGTWGPQAVSNAQGHPLLSSAAAARPGLQPARLGPGLSPAQHRPDLGPRTGVGERVSTNGGVTQGIPAVYPSLRVRGCDASEAQGGEPGLHRLTVLASFYPLGWALGPVFCLHVRVLSPGECGSCLTLSGSFTTCSASSPRSAARPSF